MTPAKPDGIVRIEVGEFFFEPQNLVISVGTTVEWVPIGEQPHTIDSKTSPVEFNGRVGTKGGPTFLFKFEQPGTFLYDCRIHPGVMDAVILVKE